MQQNKEIFSNIYKNKSWIRTIEDPLSGPGSSLEYTENLRARLPSILKYFKINVLLDAGCGDLTWMGTLIETLEVKYIGIDIVDSLIEEHKRKYPLIEFYSKDITSDTLPVADMMMCRDCLFHMSNIDIFKTLHNFVNSKIPYLFTTSHVTDFENYDIATGGFRLLNLRKTPFNFSTPLFSMDDTFEDHPERKISVWSREQIATILGLNP